ncbi:transcriptional regulator, TetR family [Actinacidiphila yanglinensis]|uniref:Transcriptional regulator, TetR family n=1 Tax=Actinacidiphila yanglinensis TaxID=310779 RepID=A0A1H6CT44_9ACTN|nr:TetR family transcriptional regulator [Actinacidiphila yanglinensis]SEG76162.1 transcriptional regulator, TetR family [Actinacidiphila yanglinensis]
MADEPVVEQTDAGWPGLRERKKLRTSELISDTAVELFMARGFDNVSVADVADAAEVSKKTVFNYFPAKEDLVLSQIGDHEDEAARVVREREPGESPVAALRRHFLALLRAFDPIAGLTDIEEVLAFRRMVLSTPSLKLRLLEQWSRGEESLARALAEALDRPADALLPAALAAQVIAVQRVLSGRNLERMLAGERPADVLAECTAEAEAAFGLLEAGV